MGCINLRLKYGMGWSCHKKMVRFFIPLDQKRSANLFHGHLAITFSSQNCSHYRSCTAGSTTNRLSCSALPLTDFEIIPAQCGFPQETAVMWKVRSNTCTGWSINVSISVLIGITFVESLGSPMSARILDT